MKRPAFARAVLACALLLLAASPGRSDILVWNEVWRTSQVIVADNGLGSVYLEPIGNAPAAALVWTSYDPVNWPGPQPPPQPPEPAVFKNDPFRLILFLQDVQSGATGTLTYQGLVNGSFSPQFSGLRLTITPPADTTLHLGHRVYHVSVDTSVQPGLPGDSGVDIGARITVTQNPEPSALLLAALGAPGLALMFGRRRSARRQATRRGP